jgi:hypothetical protein
MIRIIITLICAWATLTFLQETDWTIASKLAFMGVFWYVYGYVVGVIDSYTYVTGKMNSLLNKHD